MYKVRKNFVINKIVMQLSTLTHLGFVGGEGSHLGGLDFDGGLRSWRNLRKKKKKTIKMLAMRFFRNTISYPVFDTKGTKLLRHLSWEKKKKKS